MNWNLGLNFYSSEVLLFNPNDLAVKEVKAYIQQEKFHIYIICKRKKIFFESSEVDGDFCNTILYYLDGNHNKVYLKYRHPNTLVINGYEKGYYNIIFKGKAMHVRDFQMISNFSYLDEDEDNDLIIKPMPSDLEVMYVGQAFGRTSIKTIDYRVSHHEKIQKLALSILDEGSSEEVLVIGAKIKNNDISMSLMSVEEEASESFTSEGLQELIGKAGKRVKEGQEVTLFEASLIKYFQPALNTEYKETFPSADFSSYDEIYKTDFNYVSFALDTRPVFVRLFSEHIIKRAYTHGDFYSLTEDKDKKSLFEYIYNL